MKNFLLIAGLLVAVGTALGHGFTERVAAPLIQDGWWEVPCVDVIAFPDANLDVVQEAADLGLLKCVRKHTHDVTPAREAFAALVPDADWQDIGLLLIGEGTTDGERVMMLGLSLTGTVMIAHDAVDFDPW